VFETTDDGTSWTSLNIGLTNPSVLSLSTSGGGTLPAGTNGGSVFSLELMISTFPRAPVTRVSTTPVPRVVPPYP